MDPEIARGIAVATVRSWGRGEKWEASESEKRALQAREGLRRET